MRLPISTLLLTGSALVSTAAAAAPAYSTSVTVPYDSNAAGFCQPNCTTTNASNNSSYTVRTGADATNFYVDVQSTPNAATNTSLQFANIYLGGTHVTNNLVIDVTNSRATTTDNTSVYTSLVGTGYTFNSSLNDISFAIPFAYLVNNPNNLNYGFYAPGDLIRISLSQSFGYSLVAGSNFDPVTRLGAQIVPAATGAVPEMATWAMMLAGFGAVGFAMRRRQVIATVNFA